MKITHNKVGQNLNTNDSAKTDKAEKAGAAKGAGIGDAKAAALSNADLGASKVDVSPRAQQMKKAKEIANSTPDINEEKVARLQKLIDDGKYNVSAKDIADRMVDEEISYS